jgi:hypothetical protein
MALQQMVSVVKTAVEQVPEQHVFPGAHTTPVATHCAGTVLEDAILDGDCEELSEGVVEVLGVGAGVEIDAGEVVEDADAELLGDDEDRLEDNDVLDEIPREDDTALQLPNPS